MKKYWMVLCLFLSLGMPCMAAENVEPPADCKHCGMDRTAFSHSRMLVTYSDGEEAGICSLHCAVIEMKKNSGRKIRTIMVADYYSRKLTDARTAVWVIGGNKRGVMSPVAKWAFAAKKDAERFVKENGGKIATFDDAMRRTEEDFE